LVAWAGWAVTVDSQPRSRPALPPTTACSLPSRNWLTLANSPWPPARPLELAAELPMHMNMRAGMLPIIAP